MLRGPQGTLYGQGSAGGTIIYHTRDPDLDSIALRTETFLSSTSGAGGLNFGVSGAVSIPLVTDKLAIRVSGGYDKRAGYVDVFNGLPGGTPFKKNANDIENKDIRAVILWKPTDRLSVRAQAFHFEPSQDYTQSLQSLEPAQLWFNGGAKAYEKGNFDLYSVAADYDLGFANLRSATSYLDATASYLQGAFIGVPGLLFNGYDAYSFSQELQLRSAGDGPLHWLGGVYYQKARSKFSFVANFPGFLIGDGFTDTSTKNYSLFGEVSYDLLDGKVVPLFGVRYYKDDRSFVADSNNIPIAGAGSGENKPHKFTWRANLSFHPSDDLTAFMTVSTGFRSGITQTPFQVAVLGMAGIPSSIALEPDSLTNYEAGLKARTFDGAVQLGLNVYRIDFKDNQLGLTPFGIAAFANAGKAKTTGVDVELRWRTPIRGLNMGVVGNWNDSKFGDVPAAVSAQVPAVTEGKRLINTSKYNYRFDADYEGQLTDSLRFFVNGSASRMSNRVMVDGYVVAAHSNYDASVGIRSDKWELALFGDNLSDERGPSYALAGASGVGAARFTGPYPRTIGVRLRTNID